MGAVVAIVALGLGVWLIGTVFGQETGGSILAWGFLLFIVIGFFKR